jgi:hypothetical protein
MAEDPKTEDGGVLGNLPRTRPGRRSEKRSAGRPAEAAGAAAEKAEAGGGAAARTPRPKRATTRSRPAGARSRRPAEPAPEPSRGGPIGDVVHTAGKVVGAGARVAEGLAKEVLRRLPRP